MLLSPKEVLQCPSDTSIAFLSLGQQFLFWIFWGGLFHPPLWTVYSVYLSASRPLRVSGVNSPVIAAFHCLALLVWSLFEPVRAVSLSCRRAVCVALPFWLNDGAALAATCLPPISYLPTVGSRLLHPLRGVRLGETYLMLRRCLQPLTITGSLIYFRT